MDGLVEFYRLLGAVLAANLLTAAFIYAVVQYSKLEREGREKLPGQGAGQHLATMIFVCAFLLGSILLTTSWPG